jgi:predicted transcriptional regulator
MSSFEAAAMKKSRQRDGAIMGDETHSNFIGLTAEIVSAYVSNNAVPSGDIPALINQVHSALLRVSSGQGELASEPLKPAVPVKRSINPDFIVCLEDGKKFKSLKRHLRTQYGMTPEQYREKWGLVPDYPMVAPNYAAARSQLAKQMGLGQQRRRRK